MCSKQTFVCQMSSFHKFVNLFGLPDRLSVQLKDNLYIRDEPNMGNIMITIIILCITRYLPIEYIISPAYRQCPPMG